MTPDDLRTPLNSIRSCCRPRAIGSACRRAITGLDSDWASRIAKHIIELHGGTISAHSEGRQRGARFTLALPIA